MVEFASHVVKFHPMGRIGGAILTACFLSACGAEPKVSQPTVPEVANVLSPAEATLKGIIDDKATGIVFTISPHRRTSCKSMDVEVSRKDASDGYWVPIETISASYDYMNPSKAVRIENQIHYGIIQNSGDFGITSVTCHPFEGEPIEWRQLVATFKPEYGKLNYLGNIRQHSLSKQTYIYALEDAYDTVGLAVGNENPSLFSYLQSNLANEALLLNYTGKTITVDEVVSNIDRSADYFTLYAALKRRVAKLKNAADKASLNTDYVPSQLVPQTVHNIAYVRVLAD